MGGYGKISVYRVKPIMLRQEAFSPERSRRVGTNGLTIEDSDFGKVNNATGMFYP